MPADHGGAGFGVAGVDSWSPVGSCRMPMIVRQARDPGARIVGNPAEEVMSVRATARRRNRFASWADDLFWSLYATGYDGLLRLKGYQHLYRRLRGLVAQGARGRVLDAGCGTGNLEVLACRELSGSRVWGLDRCPAMLRRARRKVSTPNVCFDLADLNQPLGFQDSSLDLIVSVNCLYALARPREVLREFARCLRPGGRCLISNPSPIFSSRALLLQHLAQVRSLREVVELFWLVPATIPVLILNLVVTIRFRSGAFAWTTPEEIEAWLREAGLEPQIVESAYGGQNVLALAVKPVVPPPPTSGSCGQEV